MKQEQIFINKNLRAGDAELERIIAAFNKKRGQK